ncbi:MAG: hypothetical protein ABI949_14135 [Ilumatobacteraceae bacterium]
MANDAGIWERRIRIANESARRRNLAAAAIAVFTGLAAVLLPLGSSVNVDSSGVATTTRMSLLTSEGPSVLFIVTVPVVLVAVPLFLRSGRAAYRARIVSVVLLTVLALLGAMSIGLFFVPTLIVMITSMAAQSGTYDRIRSSTTEG